jgi:uncharacterized protein YifE (UPF0438 family)
MENDFENGFCHSWSDDVKNKFRHKNMLKARFKMESASERYAFSQLTSNEKKQLKSYGEWIRALNKGIIDPYTEDQRAFRRRNFTGNLDPSKNVLISAWLKFHEKVTRMDAGVSIARASWHKPGL